jgi:hypothetical protein
MGQLKTRPETLRATQARDRIDQTKNTSFLGCAPNSGKTNTEKTQVVVTMSRQPTKLKTGKPSLVARFNRTNPKPATGTWRPPSAWAGVGEDLSACGKCKADGGHPAATKPWCRNRTGERSPGRALEQNLRWREKPTTRRPVLGTSGAGSNPAQNRNQRQRWKSKQGERSWTRKQSPDTSRADTAALCGEQVQHAREIFCGDRGRIQAMEKSRRPGVPGALRQSSTKTDWKSRAGEKSRRAPTERKTRAKRSRDSPRPLAHSAVNKNR